MRPTTDQLLRSLRESLTDVVIPAVGDDWARYVAKGMEKILMHLEQRAAHEHEYCVQDTLELRALFAQLVSTAALGPVVQPVLAEPALAESDPPSVVALREENERHRAALVAVIDRVEVEDASAELAALRPRVRAVVRAELDRDIELARPTFMLFGPPTPTR